MKIFKIAFSLFIFSLANTLSAQRFSQVSISNVSVINTATYDFSPAFYKDGIVFVSNNEITGKYKMFDKKINEKAMSLFIARHDDKGLLSTPEPFAIELVSKVHEGPIAFEKDFKTLYISRNNNRKRNGKAKYASNFVDYMKIYMSKLGEKGWSKPKAMKINAKNSDACHPALSPEGDRLYFSSNRPGGFGGMDLYVCKKANGKWGKPMNLGAKINSDKNDAFPYIHNDGTLYFSSDREGGKGGLDIYYYEFDKNSTTSSINYYDTTPLSIGAPFNSEKDDFGFILDTDSKKGYFTSSRNGGAGEDDIYAFDTSHKIEKPVQRAVTIKVIDRKTNAPIKSAEILATNTNTKANNPSETKKMPLKTDEKGTTTITVTPTDNYAISINRAGYKPKKLTYLKDETRNEIIVILDAELEVAVVEKPAEINTPLIVDKKPEVVKVEHEKESVFELKNIYYDFDDASIRKDAAATLDSLAQILRQYPNMYLEVASYTDSRGTSEYNEKLSKKRSENAAKYLMTLGIDPTHLKQVPYGERKLLFEDEQKTILPSMKHQMNRRTELRIIKIVD